MDVYRELLRKIATDRSFAREVRDVSDNVFLNGTKNVKDAIYAAYDEYERDLSLTEVAKHYLSSNPHLSSAKVAQVQAVFDNMSKVEDIGIDVARDIVRKLSIQQGAREVAEEAVKVVSGDHYDPYPIINKLEDLKKIHAATHTGDERVLDLDIDSLLEGMDDEYHYTFNLPSLNKLVPGMQKGMLCIFGARPNVGKSMFWHYSVAGAGGFLDQGAKVLCITNEELARRHTYRMMSAATQISTRNLSKYPDELKTRWSKIQDNLLVLDGDQMTLGEIEMKIETERPDVVCVDILDKVPLSGSFAREDLRLTELYGQARSIAKRYDCVFMGFNQLSADAEGRTSLDYGMMSGSKTGKAGEADLIILIGKENVEEGDTNMRWINIVKNKINGTHYRFACVADSYTACFRD